MIHFFCSINLRAPTPTLFRVSRLSSLDRLEFASIQMPHLPGLTLLCSLFPSTDSAPYSHTAHEEQHSLRRILQVDRTEELEHSGLLCSDCPWSILFRMTSSASFHVSLTCCARANESRLSAERPREETESFSAGDVHGASFVEVGALGRAKECLRLFVPRTGSGPSNRRVLCHC